MEVTGGCDPVPRCGAWGLFTGSFSLQGRGHRAREVGPGAGRRGLVQEGGVIGPGRWGLEQGGGVWGRVIMPGGRVWGRGGAWGRERRLPLGPQLGAAGGSGLWGRRQAHLPPPRSGRAEKAPFTRALLVRTKAAFKPLPRSHTCQPPGSPHTCAGPRLRARTPGRGPSGQDGAARRPPCADPLPQQVLPASPHPRQPSLPPPPKGPVSEGKAPSLWFSFRKPSR